MNDEFPYAIETLLEQCGDSKDIAGIILEEFVVQIADDTKEIKQSLTDGDLLQAGKAAHRLKGSAGVVGATKLHSLCIALEQAVKEAKDADKGAKIYDELKVEAQRCIDAVPTVREKL